MKLFSFSSEPIVQALGWTLLHAIWQGFALAIVAAGMLFLLSHRASYSRYWTGISALFLQVLLSIGTFAIYYQPQAVQTTWTKMSHLAQPILATATPNHIANVVPWYQQALWFLQAHLGTIVLFWIIGASVLMVRLVGSWVYVQQLKAEGIRLTDANIQKVFRRIATLLNVRSTVHLFESVRVSTPIVIGFIKPVVLLPAGLATGLTTKQIEAILAHELAHIKRYDYLINLLQSLVEIVYFFHPALWWVSSKVRTEREHCCDDIAIEVCGDKLAFAKALAEVEAYRQTPVLAMAFASQKGAMLHRVRRVLGITEKRQQRMGPTGLLLILSLVVGVSVYALQPQDKPTKKTKASNVSHTSKDAKFVLDKEGKLTKVVWKKRQLSTKEVMEIQALKQQIEAGEIELSHIQNVEQKAILSHIVDVENGLEKGLDNLSAGLAAIDFDNIVISENQLNELSEKALEISEPFTEAIRVTFPDTLDERKMREHQRRMDSLSRLMQPQHQKMEALRLAMEQHEFKVNELERKMELLEWKKNKAGEERNQALEKRSQTMYDDAQKVKKSEAEIEKIVEQFEEQIKQRETHMQQLNQQMGELRQQVQTARKPIEELEAEAQKLEQLNEELSRRMEKEAEAMELMMPPPPPPIQNFRAKPVRAMTAPTPPAKVRTPRAVAPVRTPRPARMPASETPPVAPKKK
jgi:bla regulator protein BlaR1